MKRKRLLIMMLVFLVFSLVGCTEETNDGALSQESTEIVNEIDDIKTEQNGIEYFFEPGICEKEEAEAVIQNIDTFISAFGTPAEQIAVFVGTESEADFTVHISGKELSLEDYTSLYSSAYGEPEDEVMAYGAVAAVCEREALCEVENEYTDEALAEYFSNADNLYIADLTLPMIEEHFLDADAAAHGRSAAKSFARYCYDAYGGEKLLALSAGTLSTEDVTLLKNEWLTSIGANAEYTPVAPLQYKRCVGARASDKYPYVIEGESYRIYFSSEDVKAEGYQAFIEPYMTVSPLYELDFADAREALEGIAPEKKYIVDIFTDFLSSEKKYEIDSGYYDNENDMLVLLKGWSLAHEALLHEYVHFLTRSYMLSPLYEGMTEAVANFVCQNRMRRMQATLHNDESVEFLKENDLWDYELGSIDIKKLYTFFGYKFYCYGEGETVNGDYYSIWGKHYDRVPEEVTLASMSYISAASFSMYLFELYGMKTVYDASANMLTLEKLWGKPFDEIYNDWGEWVTAKVSEYGGY